MVNPRLPNTKREEVWRGGPPNNLYPYHPCIWAIYNDLSRGHLKWWFTQGNSTRAVSCTVSESLQNPLTSGLGIIPAVWYIHLHLVDLYGFSCRWKYNRSMDPIVGYTHAHIPWFPDPKSCPKKGRSHELCCFRHSRWAFHPSLLVREIFNTRWAHFGL